ncbi:MAG TPA: S53 family peptidase [Polyangiaceae bacterium]
MSRRTRLMGSARALAAQGGRGGAVAPGTRMSVLLVLRTPRSAPPLVATAEHVVRDRRPLTHEEYFARYQADAEDVGAVLRFAGENRLTPTKVDRRARAITLEGSVADMQRAFDVALVEHLYADKTYRAHEGDATLPPELDGVVRWIFGLNDVPLAPLGHAGPTPLASKKNEPGPHPALGDVGARPHEKAPWTSYTPPEFAKMYDFPEELLGRGACVGVLELYGGYLRSDMDAFFAGVGVPMPSIVDVGANVQSSGADAWANFEVTMDVEVAASCAPEARCVVYFSGAAGFDEVTARTYFELLSTAILDDVNKPDALTMSWGLPEGAPNAWTRPDAEVVDELFVVAAILGITACLPSGDSGSIYPITWGMFNAPSLVYYPGSSPWGLSVGGTTARIRDGQIVDEVVWNRLAHNMRLIYGSDVQLCNLGSSGGGVSHFFEKPAWQARADVPEATLYDFESWTFSNPRSMRGRGVPDVAANTDFLVGYKIYVQGGWRYGGGTSASTPFTAALMTRLREGVGQRLGFLNPLLYKLQLEDGVDVLHPIVEGNNGGYVAGPDRRWNPCTGLGAIRGRPLLVALRRAFGR